MKPSHKVIIMDSKSSLCLGESDTEEKAIDAAIKDIETSRNQNPRQVTIHTWTVDGYSTRSAVVSTDGLLSK